MTKQEFTEWYWKTNKKRKQLYNERTWGADGGEETCTSHPTITTTP